MTTHPRHALKQRQRGISLVFALLALIALTLGAVALVRSVDTSVLALGNLAFRQAGVAVATRGTEDALAWMEAGDKVNDGTLNNDIVGNGYYATSLDTLDVAAKAAGSATTLARVDWENDGCKVNGQDEASTACIQASPVKMYGSDEVRYVITRLCPVAGPDNDRCARPPLPATTEGSARDGNKGLQGGIRTLPRDYSPYFRIVVRTKGPRGTVSFTETLVHF